ncbi:MAG: DNA-binding protein Alba [Candidatus Altiarchaeota archaeon]|nr:DNA-binding protein Alba [Candidatus Altiarchaeota archaeon]
MAEKLGDNIVLVGRKEIMSYVLAVVTQFNAGEKDVIIKARGKAISRAVDIAEIVKRRFVQNLNTGDIVIGTEEIQGDEGPVKVSTIEITLAKQG